MEKCFREINIWCRWMGVNWILKKPEEVDEEEGEEEEEEVEEDEADAGEDEYERWMMRSRTHRLWRGLSRVETVLLALGFAFEVHHVDRFGYGDRFGVITTFAAFLICILRYFAYKCYAELASLYPPMGTGGRYTFVLRVIGELPAYLVAWLTLLEKFISTQLYLQTCSNLWRDIYNLPVYPFQFDDPGVFNKAEEPRYFVLVPGVACLLFLLNLQRTKWILITIIIFVNTTWVVGLVALWVRSDLPSVKISYLGREDAAELLRQCRWLDQSMSDFDLVLSLGEEAHRPRRVIPNTVVGVFVNLLPAYIFAIFTYIASRSRRSHDASRKFYIAPFYAVFENSGFMSKFMRLGEICSVCLNTFSCLFCNSRLIYILSHDELGLKWFSRVSRITGTPLITTFLTWILSMLLGIFFVGNRYLSDLAMVSSTLGDLIIVICVLITRYRHEPSSSSTEYLNSDDKHRWALFNFPNRLHSTSRATEKIAYLCIVIAVTSNAVFVLLFSDILSDTGGTLFRVLFVFSFLAFFTSLLVLSNQPRNERRYLSQSVSGVPSTCYLLIFVFTAFLSSYDYRHYLFILIFFVIVFVVYVLVKYFRRCIKKDEADSGSSST